MAGERVATNDLAAARERARASLAELEPAARELGDGPLAFETLFDDDPGTDGPEASA